jgi:hypothetical protein
VKLTTQLHLVPRSRIHGAIPPLPQYAFMAWCSVRHRKNFTFTLYISVLHPSVLPNRLRSCSIVSSNDTPHYVFFSVLFTYSFLGQLSLCDISQHTYLRRHLFVPRPTSRLEDYNLVIWWLYRFVDVPHIWRPSLPSAARGRSVSY